MRWGSTLLTLFLHNRLKRGAYRLAQNAQTKPDEPVSEALNRTLDAIGGQAPDVDVLAAAAAVLTGCVVDMAGNTAREEALCIAALASSLCFPGTHLCTTSDKETARIAARLSGSAKRLGIQIGIINKDTPFDMRRAAYRDPLTLVCAQELASDVLRDRLIRGAARNPLAVKLQRLRQGPKRQRLLLTGLRRVILSDPVSLLLDHARKPVVVHEMAVPFDPPERLREAMGLASTLLAPHDFDVTAEGVVMTVEGEDRVSQNAHLYPVLAPETALGRHCLLGALAVKAAFRIDTHYQIENQNVREIEDPDNSLIGFSDALPYLKAAHDLPPSPRRVPVARTSLQRLFSRYQAVAGLGLALGHAGLELRNTYGVKGLLKIGPQIASRVSVRLLAGEEEIETFLAQILSQKTGPLVVVLPSEPDAYDALQCRLASQNGSVIVRANAVQALRKEPAASVFLITPRKSRSEEAQMLEQIASKKTRVTRIVDTTALSYARWPRSLRLAIALLPGRALRNLTVEIILRGILALEEREKFDVRSALLKYDHSLDDMLSFAGEAE